MKFKQAMDEHRYGKFFISDGWVREKPDLVQELLSQVLIVDATYKFDPVGIEYYAVSPQFDASPIGLQASWVGIRQIQVRGLNSLEIVRLEFCEKDEVFTI